MSISYEPQPPARTGADREPATATEALDALAREGPSADAVRSYLAPGPQPRYDTPTARAEAAHAALMEARAAEMDREAGG